MNDPEPDIIVGTECGVSALGEIYLWSWLQKEMQKILLEYYEKMSPEEFKQ